MYGGMKNDMNRISKELAAGLGVLSPKPIKNCFGLISFHDTTFNTGIIHGVDLGMTWLVSSALWLSALCPPCVIC